VSLFCFFFQAEDGIRDFHVTGVQTCALPILLTGLLGGLVLMALAVATGRRAAAGQPTDVAQQGISDPPVARWLFADLRSAPLWFGLRLYLGYEWLAAGWH